MIYSEGSFFEFIEVIETWSLASGNGSYSFIEWYVNANIIDSTTMKLQARGSMEVYVDTSIDITLTADLQIASYSVGTTTGQTTTFRKLQTWSKTFSK